MKLFGVPLSESSVWPGALTGSEAGVSVYYRPGPERSTLELNVSNRHDAIKLHATAATLEGCLAKMMDQLDELEADAAKVRRAVEAGL